VLAAANRFVQENKRTPSSLSELVPAFISELPQVPVVDFQPAQSQLSFFYVAYADGIDFGCTCKAKLKQKEFKCHCIG
jgi:hypothetical protein